MATLNTFLFRNYDFDGMTDTYTGSSTLGNSSFNFTEETPNIDSTLVEGESLDGDGLPFTYRGTVEVGGELFYLFQVLGFGGFSLHAAAPGSTYPNTFTTSDIDTSNEVFCFAEGTQIATPSGESRVETLTIGDLITTADGRAVRVKWVGRQMLAKFRDGAAAQPVRIQAGGLGNGLPHTDLTVTADHGMVIDDLVINAAALVNGSTIDFVPMNELDDIFTVYHVETEDHDVILANGAAAETFVDYAARKRFGNYDEYLDLYGAERIIPEMPRPRISSARQLPQALKERLGIEDTGRETRAA